MPKLGVFSGHDICRLLSEHGFFLVRQKGSHAIMQMQTPRGTITGFFYFEGEARKKWEKVFSKAIIQDDFIPKRIERNKQEGDQQSIAPEIKNPID
ncbi:MAG TPA: type II toxin-antitoxin system HicA family toxin [Kiritimatiellia bacterium]|nr:type II toxin-antitoxin system HicA family toxin [Kiritimatiellia bacterium]